MQPKLKSSVFLRFNLFEMIKRAVLVVSIFISLFSALPSAAQCSICTKTAQQLGEKPAKGLNSGIIYLAITPFLIAGYVYYRWKKSGHTA